MAKKHSISKSIFFRYLQIRHFIQTYNPSFPQLPASSNLDVILKIPLTLKGQISNLYNSIMSFSSVSTENIKTKWEEELGTVISDETWVRALSCVNGTSSCVRLNLIQFKVLHRTHYSKARLAKIYPELDDTCDRCKATNADLAHMFWSCSKLEVLEINIWDFECCFWPASTT